MNPFFLILFCSITISGTIMALLHLRASRYVMCHRRRLYRRCKSAPIVTILAQDVYVRETAYKADLEALGLSSRHSYHFPAWMEAEARADLSAFILSHTKSSELPREKIQYHLKRACNYRSVYRLYLRYAKRMREEAYALLPRRVRAFADDEKLPFTICKIPQAFYLRKLSCQFYFGTHRVAVPITRRLLKNLLHEAEN